MFPNEPGIKADDLWIRKIRRGVKDQTHWAVLRVKKDSQGKDYIDVLGGRSRELPHAHIEINLDMTTKFFDGRGEVRSSEMDFVSQKRGYLGSKKLMVDDEVTPTRNLVLRFKIYGDTREVTVSEFRWE